ncbi:MAG: isoleucine--tRNA ligase [Clostridiaceae bacterium]|nr:isoleucine--tRNA ligase [Clostridiaceae bacterium]
MYKPVSNDMAFVGREKDVLSFWKEHSVFEASVKKREGAPEFTFYDGPPTANGKPHIGHILTRCIKDIIPRYKTMKGYHVLRKAGWDTHGLPVELEVEKALGINGKPQIEAYGVEAFNKQCKESVWKYKGEWERMSDRVGFWADMDHPYVTYENDYIESEWWALRQIWDRDLLYKGYKVVPYCPRCGTALSSHEVAQGYKDVKETSIYVRFRVEGEEDTWFAAWTTAPWTLPSNVALCVNAEMTYALAEVSTDLDGTQKPVRYYLAADLVSDVLGEDARVLKTFQGSNLVGKTYEPLLPYANAVVEASGKSGFRVTSDDYVTLTDGTGIVHIAPAFGEDDARVGRIYDLPFVQMVLEDGTMHPDVVDFAGMFCKEADAGITKKLALEGKLMKKVPYEHSYPFCWRCDTPLIYYARHSWFIRMTDVRDRLVANNKTVNWVPASIGEGRFGNWLENVIDWAVTRERYWETPLPIWECAGCGHRHAVGSIAELREMSPDCPEEIELHRPYIDQVHLDCPTCGGVMTRVPEVIDCWFDAGSMPFAQWHFPFENQDMFERQFPADFISEAVDQTRGWFYTLMAISTLLFDQSPYKNVVVLGLVQDKDGQKMSKHKGNVIDPWDVLEKQGADAVRWYFYSASAPWLPSRFSDDAVSEGQRRFMGTLWNTYAFYVMYANIDGFDPVAYVLDKDGLPAIDRWVLSRLHSLIASADGRLADYDITGAARAIGDFVDELSNWYVRRNRERFWQPGMPQDKINAYMTLYTVLETLSRLVAPFVPFMAEAMHQNLVRPEAGQSFTSVHLCDYPVSDPARIDTELEHRMGDVLTLVALGRAARNACAVKTRQPLSRMIVVGAEDLPEEYRQLAAEELNVKSFEAADDASVLVGYRFKPQLRTLGRKLGALLPKVSAALTELDGRAAMRELEQAGRIELEVGGQKIELEREDLIVETVQPEGLSTMGEGRFTVALDTTMTPELLAEGMVREIVSKIQTMRKDAGFEVMDRILVRYNGSAAVDEIVQAHSDWICEEVLADRMDRVEGDIPSARAWNINGENMNLSVEKR